MKYEYPCKKGTPSYKEKNDISPVAYGKGSNPAMEKSLFNPSALSSEIPTNGEFAKKGKGGMVNPSVAKSKSNTISPTSDY